MMKRKTINNSIFAVLANTTNILLSFFAQRVFLSILNTEYLGLNGLFSNIISMLAIFELGIGNAIIFSLYKPLVKDDKRTIKALMNFYKKAYRIIAIIVAIVGVSIAPFLPLLIKEVTVDINIYIVYLMFVADVVCSYFLTYRRSILYADQKNYQINIVHIGYLVVMNFLQLSILALTKNYYLYLGVKVVMRIIENLVIHSIVRVQYPYLNKLGVARLDKAIEEDIFKKIKALLFHKIGGFIVMGSDNLIISKFIGLIEVGLYSNYFLIINAMDLIVGQAITALTPTIGHKLALQSSGSTYDAFKKTRFVGFVIACLITANFFCCVQPFMTVWLGEQYLLGFLTVAALSFNMFLRLQRYAYSTFKEAAGIYHEDRFIPLIESALNIIASIILLQFFGITGVFLGTIVSSLALWCYSYPKYVYKKLFNRNYFVYVRETLGYVAVFVISAAVSYLIVSQIRAGSLLVQLIINAMITTFTTVVIIALSLHKTGSFEYFVSHLPLIKKVASHEK